MRETASGERGWATRYFEELGRLCRATQVTARDGLSVDSEEGVSRVVNLALTAQANDRKLMFIGNGGSAAIASHLAIDYWKNGGIRATAFNDPALLTCLANDYGYECVFEKTIDVMAQHDDVLVAISSSGCSRNILNGVKAARQRRCSVVTLSGFAPDNPLRRLGDLNFYIPTAAYGFVEISHLAIGHAVLDLACEQQQWKGER